MRNEHLWKPSKFVVKDGLLVGNDKIVKSSSIVFADLVASKIQNAITNFSSGQLLDLGCGKAPLYIWYKAFSDSITCVDWSNSIHDVSYIDKAQDLNHPLEFSDDSFDTVILTDVLEHIPYPINLMNEIKRVLKPNGKLIVSVPFSYWIHESPYDYNRYTGFMLDRLGVDSGLKVVSKESFGSQFECLLDILGKSSLRVKGRVSRKLTQALFNVLYFLYRMKILAPSYKTNEQPLGYVVVYENESK